MGVLDRMATLVRANINDALDKAEDPEKMLNQILRDMANQIQEAKGQVATMMAQERMLEAQVDDAQDDVQMWEGRAERMVKSGNDQMAREAIKGKQDAQQHVATLQSQLENQQTTVKQLRSQLDALERKYQQSQDNKSALLARYHRAQAQQQMTNTATAVGGAAHDYGSDLSRIEDRIKGAEALAGAQQELAASESGPATDWGDDTDSQVEDELSALKQRLGVGGEQAPQANQPNQGGVDTIKMS